MFPALIIVPALQICWTLFSILSGMLYFHEYEGMRAGPTAMFVIGVAVSAGTGARDAPRELLTAQLTAVDRLFEACSS